MRAYLDLSQGAIFVSTGPPARFHETLWVRPVRGWYDRVRRILSECDLYWLLSGEAVPVSRADFVAAMQEVAGLRIDVGRLV